MHGIHTLKHITASLGTSCRAVLHRQRIVVAIASWSITRVYLGCFFSVFSNDANRVCVCFVNVTKASLLRLQSNLHCNCVKIDISGHAEIAGLKVSAGRRRRRWWWWRWCRGNLVWGGASRFVPRHEEAGPYWRDTMVNAFLSLGSWFVWWGFSLLGLTCGLLCNGSILMKL